MESIFYLKPFLLSFFLAILGIVFLQSLLLRGSVRDMRHNSRHIHVKSISRFGGVALVVAFLMTVCLNTHIVLTPAWWGSIIASVLILIIGLWDDIQEISWKWQLTVQVLAGSIAFAFGIRLISIRNPLSDGVLLFDSGWMLIVGFILTVVWIVAVMNAMNWADGMDGLCGGISLIGFVTIFFLSLRPEVNQPPMAILALVLGGASLGFLIFNFYPARIFAGTSGSWFLGFMMAALALFSGAKIATVMLVLALPLGDALWVIWSRFHDKVSIFTPDQRHLHHRLRKLGWSSPSIALFIYTITALIATTALHTDTHGKLVTLGIVLIGASFFYAWIEKQSKCRSVGKT